jgi:hypothetical protein
VQDGWQHGDTFFLTNNFKCEERKVAKDVMHSSSVAGLQGSLSSVFPYFVCPCLLDQFVPQGRLMCLRTWCQAGTVESQSVQLPNLFVHVHLSSSSCFMWPSARLAKDGADNKTEAYLRPCKQPS